MDILNNPPISKVTLSCKVTPEQKFFIANKAKELGVSVAQYAEAKVLRQDDITLERRLAQLEQEKKELQEYHDKVVALKDDLYSWVEEGDMITDFHLECGHYEFWEDDPYSDEDIARKSTSTPQVVDQVATPEEVVVEPQSTSVPPPVQEQAPQPPPPKMENRPPPPPSFTVYFRSKESLQIFRSQIDDLFLSFDLNDFNDVAMMCVDYTSENKNSKFFLSTVKEFVQKNY